MLPLLLKPKGVLSIFIFRVFYFVESLVKNSTKMLNFILVDHKLGWRWPTLPLALRKVA